MVRRRDSNPESLAEILPITIATMRRIVIELRPDAATAARRAGIVALVAVDPDTAFSHFPPRGADVR